MLCRPDRPLKISSVLVKVTEKVPAEESAGRANEQCNQNLSAHKILGLIFSTTAKPPRVRLPFPMCFPRIFVSVAPLQNRIGRSYPCWNYNRRRFATEVCATYQQTMLLG